MTKCARSAVVLDEEVSNYVDIEKELHGDVRWHTTFS